MIGNRTSVQPVCQAESRRDSISRPKVPEFAGLPWETSNVMTKGVISLDGFNPIPPKQSQIFKKTQKQLLPLLEEGAGVRTVVPPTFA